MDPILDNNILAQVKDAFKELKQPVEVIFFGSKTTSCDYCIETRQLMGELVPLTNKITLVEYDLENDAEIARQYHVDKVPSLVITARDGDKLTDYGVRFSGIPAGSEFTSLIRGLLQVSSRDSGLSKESRAYLAGLDKPIHLQVFVTPT
jgi:alkyl hydroperoxide reductase subunit AhpF